MSEFESRHPHLRCFIVLFRGFGSNIYLNFTCSLNLWFNKKQCESQCEDQIESVNGLIIRGKVSERFKERDCKLCGIAIVGSNPTLSISFFGYSQSHSLAFC